MDNIVEYSLLDDGDKIKELHNENIDYTISRFHSLKRRKKIVIFCVAIAFMVSLLCICSVAIFESDIIPSIGGILFFLSVIIGTIALRWAFDVEIPECIRLHRIHKHEIVGDKILCVYCKNPYGDTDSKLFEHNNLIYDLDENVEPFVESYVFRYRDIVYRAHFSKKVAHNMTMQLFPGYGKTEDDELVEGCGT